MPPGIGYSHKSGGAMRAPKPRGKKALGGAKRPTHGSSSGLVGSPMKPAMGRKFGGRR